MQPRSDERHPPWLISSAGKLAKALEKNHHTVSILYGLVRRTNEPAKELANLKRTPPCE
jgi:hypothetical protein